MRHSLELGVAILGLVRRAVTGHIFAVLVASRKIQHLTRSKWIKKKDASIPTVKTKLSIMYLSYQGTVNFLYQWFSF